MSAVRTNIIGGYHEALAALDMRLDAAGQLCRRKGPQQQIVRSGIDDALHQRRAFLPSRCNDHDKGILARLALAHRLDEMAKFRVGALNLAYRKIWWPLMDQFLESPRRGGCLDVAEPDRKKGRARRHAVRGDRIVQQDFGGVVRKSCHSLRRSTSPWTKLPRGPLTKSTMLLRARSSANDGQEIRGLQACAADQRAIDIRKREDFGGVAGLDRPAIENPHRASRFRKSRHQMFPDQGMDFDNLRRGGRFAGSDRPDWFVGNRGGLGIDPFRDACL